MVRALVLALAGAALASGASGAATGTEVMDAARLIDWHCTSCHSGALALTFLRRRFETDGPEETESFLSRHFMPDADERAAILRYLSRPE